MKCIKHINTNSASKHDTFSISTKHNVKHDDVDDTVYYDIDDKATTMTKFNATTMTRFMMTR